MIVYRISSPTHANGFISNNALGAGRTVQRLVEGGKVGYTVIVTIEDIEPSFLREHGMEVQFENTPK